MAYFSQDMKKEKAPAIKVLFKKYNIKGSMSVRNHSTFCVTLSEGSIDFRGRDINHYWLELSFDGKALEFLQELKVIMMEGNHDNSDTMTDYFDVGWYIEISAGRWNKPYVFNP